MKNYMTLQNIACGYSSGFHLKDISFTVPQGKITGIVGPNGSGKSTLFKGICGDLPIDSGRIDIQGINLSEFSLKQKAIRMAIVSQFVDNCDMTVQEYVLLGRMPYRKSFQLFETKEDFAIAKKYMQLTDVYKYKDKPMNTLSGGEQQLVSIARALTQEPELLLLDEPTAYLDISHSVQILNLIQKLSQELQLTVLLIIHDLNLASEFCDHLVMMNSGNIHFNGTPEEVLTYKNIEEVYKTVVITQQNPISKKPAIFLVSNKYWENKNDIVKV